jgi:hypothetical protein
MFIFYQEIFMIRNKLMLAALLLPAVCTQAFALVEENRDEFVKCWTACWQEELANSPQREQELNRYVAQLLDFTQEDDDAVQELLVALCQTEMCRNFTTKKDLESMLQFVNHVVLELQKTICDDSQMTFPPQLAQVAAEIERSGLSEQEYCTKLRRAFLTFTVLVSQIDAMAKAEEESAAAA